ncbi:ribonuclease R [uncultured Pseudoteredinibacter sp.]|uniref:ribonuclease R n=1 Tax=uncultured Pseudoteredinibacter sp. TaxID=1641701 RepID=UPI00261DE026|nr:ribonuclease R [uncultured Pseudoteredinibacter sp.]
MPKNKQSHDPHAEREAQKYANPIPSREFILKTLDEAAGPLTHPELCQLLELTDEESIEALRRRLIAMERDGQLMRNRRWAYGPVDHLDLIKGRVHGHKDGFGFVIPASGGDDLYLAGRQMRKVFDGDEVLVRDSGKGYRGKREGHIVEVIARNTHQVVGRFYAESGVNFVRPDNARLIHDVMIPAGETAAAEPGQYVVVEITQQPDRRQHPAGRVLEVLGDHMAPGMEIDVAIRSHGIPHLWPSDVSAEAAALDSEVAEEDKQHRVDLRDLPFVTIDGEDARDFDDAVLCIPNKKTKGWRLYVAIADVSHYVTLGSALDREAQTRGTSVYFPDHVVPMLPEAISNGLCSLNPDVDRLAMVCEMTISAKGRVSGYQFYEGLIHSHARLTYTEVGRILEERGNAQSGPRKARTQLLPYIDALHDLYKVLRENRSERGAIDFETTETRILFDDDRKIEQIVPVERNDAHKLIEECMLCANVCAARFLEKLELPALYRVHEGPGEEKLENLRDFLGEMGLSLGGRLQPKSADFQQLLQSIADRPEAGLIQTVMLRSMKQAVYSPDNKGHFGLCYPAYAHFTSPIRRYPDLLVHRAIRSVIRGRGGLGQQLLALFSKPPVQKVKGAKIINKAAIYPYDMPSMLSLGESCSSYERRADEASRDVVSWLKCEYLQDRVGETFEGIINAVTGFGIFVELKDIYVEGLVHISALPHDYYHFEAAQHRLIGEKSRQVFRLGDELRVQVVRVDLDERKVDLELVERLQGGGKKNAKKKRKSSGKIDTKANMKKLRDLTDDEERKPGEKSNSSKGKESAAKTAAKKKPSKGNKVRKAKSASASKKHQKKVKKSTAPKKRK